MHDDLQAFLSNNLPTQKKKSKVCSDPNMLQTLCELLLPVPNDLLCVLYVHIYMYIQVY